MKKKLLSILAGLVILATVLTPAPAADATIVIRIPEYYTVAQTQVVLSKRRAENPTARLQVDMGTNETWSVRWLRCVTQYQGSGLLSTSEYVCNRAWRSP